MPGRVDYIASLVDPGTKAVSVRIVAANTNRVLRKDMFVRVEINSQHEHHGILVPSSSVHARRAESAIRVRRVDQWQLPRRRIDIGSRVGDNYEVTSGLKPR